MAAKKNKKIRASEARALTLKAREQKKENEIMVLWNQINRSIDLGKFELHYNGKELSLYEIRTEFDSYGYKVYKPDGYTYIVIKWGED